MKKYTIPDIKSLDDLGVFLDAVKKGGKSIGSRITAAYKSN
ncbi:hypothetical protein Back11_01570 [Paenibacillus baekrokdamisoli]|uniref:Uncharacterized protein n=1 Tax=Paenibacillus baekrokdamisoli TaxID=1712516 RepID=A0A3G9IKV7_9BACL|nr:hypothetical protein [Paenibacillus baekrokdamisoli]MBB3069214.1 hypothetical protein [Paenibacillus baekrokdamisoli]BBH18812.1 hypothetical protein Back11_01570 [Paenibacillus baekrokdamisoli]